MIITRLNATSNDLYHLELSVGDDFTFDIFSYFYRDVRLKSWSILQLDILLFIFLIMLTEKSVLIFQWTLSE